MTAIANALTAAQKAGVEVVWPHGYEVDLKPELGVIDGEMRYDQPYVLCYDSPSYDGEGGDLQHVACGQAAEDLTVAAIKRGLVAAKWLITVEYGYGWATVTLEHRGGEFRKYEGTGRDELEALTDALGRMVA